MNLDCIGMGGKLAVSKPSWMDVGGEPRIGKTVLIDLGANKGNQDLIELFSGALEILRGN